MSAATQRKTARRPLSAACRFGRDEGASLSVEAALITPLLFWAFLATYTFFDVYRVKNLSLKANYAISDLLSRETNVIDMGYITGTRNLFRYLTKAQDATAWLRVTVVTCTDGCAVSPGATDQGRTLAIDWSRATDNHPELTADDISGAFNDVIPLIAAEERVIVVETTMDFDPAFSSTLTGIGDQIFHDVVMTRPRFAGKLCFSGVDCGL